MFKAKLSKLRKLTEKKDTSRKICYWKTAVSKELTEAAVLDRVISKEYDYFKLRQFMQYQHDLYATTGTVKYEDPLLKSVKSWNQAYI
jgi:hypothetical protein